MTDLVPEQAATMLDADRRHSDLAAAQAEVADLVVVGGGITGVGVALDAASRGLKVTLVERRDLAAGTSRWSSKLCHGGLRYISTGQIGVAWESAVERNLLARTIAPHLFRTMPFLLPILPRYPHGARVASRLLLAVADGLRAASRTPTALPRGRWCDVDEIRGRVPVIAPDAGGGYVHVDGALEDDARLVIAVARTAAGFGARIITHCGVSEVAADGVTATDELAGESLQLRARAVVVATGVWCGQLVGNVPLRPSRGSHLVMRAESLGSPTAAFNIMLPGSTSRFVFGLPRPDGLVQIGLTDTAVDRIDDVPQVSEEDERWLLEMLSSGLSRPLSSADVVGRFAGLRPLLAGGPAAEQGGTADLSRRHALIEQDGVLVITGGKLTTYRRMAQDVVDRACRRLDHSVSCRTQHLPLVGSLGLTAATGGVAASGLPARLVRRFGAEAPRVAAAGSLGALEPLAAGTPALRCELDWAVKAEGAITAEDVIERRLRYDLVDEWRAAATEPVSQMLAAPIAAT